MTTLRRAAGLVSHFDCEPRPGACFIKENIWGSPFCADSPPCKALSRAVPTFLWTKHRPPSGFPILKIKPRLDRRDQRGFLRSACAGAKLFGKLGPYLIVPKNLTHSTFGMSY